MRHPAIALSLACLLLGGCAAFNRMEVHQQRNTTIGQELTDLKKAKEAGLLNDVEYDKARDQILGWAEGISAGDEAGIPAK